jgi:hypothetical protein
MRISSQIIPNECTSLLTLTLLVALIYKLALDKPQLVIYFKLVRGNVKWQRNKMLSLL